MVNHLVQNVRWLGYEGILINEKPILYINPYKLAFPDIGDAILFTDNKPDHCSPDDVKWLRKGSTVIVGPMDCAVRFQGDVRTINSGNAVTVKGAIIEVFPVYKNKGNEKELTNGIGLNIKFSGGLRVYHPGDTVLFPEMQPGMTDVLLIPLRVDDLYRLEEAAAIVNHINPRLTIPINWDGKKESNPMIEEFKKMCNSEVEILKPKP